MKKLLLLMLLLFSITPVYAANDINVELYVLNLGKFDVATGAFTADFYLDMYCKDGCDTGDFEFMNGRATSIDKIRNDELANHELILGKPNQALIKTISETQKNKQKVLVVAGKAHVCKIKPYVPERQKIVQQFFKELDKFADKNPYSVLACPGNDLNNPQARKRRK